MNFSIFRGAAATIIDECCGALSYLLFDYSPSATAYLNITYKKPIKLNEEHYIKIKLKKQEKEKKNFMEFKVYNKNNELV